MMIASEKKATRRFLDKLQEEKYDYSIDYHNGEIKTIKLPGITINIDKETINFALGLEEFCGFNYVAEEIKVIKEFINDFQTTKENNGNNRIEDTTSLING